MSSIRHRLAAEEVDRVVTIGFVPTPQAWAMAAAARALPTWCSPIRARRTSCGSSPGRFRVKVGCPEESVLTPVPRTTASD